MYIDDFAISAVLCVLCVESTHYRRGRRGTQRAAKVKQRLKLKPQSHLAFAPGEHLAASAEWPVYIVHSPFDGSGILPVEYVEQLKQRMNLYAFRDVEPL